MQDQLILNKAQKNDENTISSDFSNTAEGSMAINRINSQEEEYVIPTNIKIKNGEENQLNQTFQSDFINNNDYVGFLKI